MALPDRLRPDVEVLWDYNQMHQRVGSADVGIGLGSHDLSVATWAAALYRQHTFPIVVFSGGSSPTTIGAFPRGEAVHYREHAMDMGVPESAILIEPAAANTGENITFTRALLQQNGRLDSIESVVFICRPYQQRRRAQGDRWGRAEARRVRRARRADNRSLNPSAGGAAR
ncbi:YdcF family protein [Nocardia sp. NPDC050793]|uniref:YdcF family protein n=1 Tax=Nocardia sp. NPDC050793 TaxID=3155159 RepID=UPI0033CEFC0B